MATNPLSHLLQSNAVPSLMEESSIRNSLIQIDSSIAALDDEIMKMEKKRKLAAEEQATHLGVLSAMRRFPPEILGEILWFALPEKLDKRGQFELLQLSTVSRNWRNAAFSNHKLWAVLDINDDQLSGFIGKEEILIDGLCRWIERSGSLPLNLSIQQCTREASDLFLQVIQRLPAKDRWKEITLFGDDTSLYAFLKYGDHRTPWDSLELLDVDTYNGHYLTYPKHPPISLQNATNLKRLKLQFSEEQISNAILHVPWAQLTELELLACIPLADYLTILKKCPNLEAYEVRLIDNKYVRLTPLAPLPSRLVFPKIRRLGMWSCSFRQIGPFLLSLELPSLDDLCIQGEDSEPYGPLATDIILDFIDFSKCEIRKLELQWMSDSDQPLFQLLTNINPVAELRITSGEIDRTLSDSLREASYGLKNLEVLEVTAVLFGTNFDPSRVAQFVYHCHYSPESTGKLKSVSLNYEGSMPEDMYESLEKEGVTFNITRI